ncbi:MAG: carbon-nitrogen hydrolase family protein [Bacteroidota bacterium]
MVLALASPPVAQSLADGLVHVEQCIAEAASGNARIVCFPEAYLPGLHGVGVEVPPFSPEDQAHVLKAVSGWAWQHGIAVVLGMEWVAPEGRQIAAVVFDARGRLLGHQAKTQLAPTEEAHYVPGLSRRLFEIDGLTFGVAICHEGFRYPETVRWAAARGAQVVFHPHWTGGDREGHVPAHWGDPEAPYYEKAAMCRALENTVFVASVNVGVRYPESATAVISPSGACVARLPYGAAGVLLTEVDLSEATGLLARRFAPERYG